MGGPPNAFGYQGTGGPRHSKPWIRSTATRAACALVLFSLAVPRLAMAAEVGKQVGTPPSSTRQEPLAAASRGELALQSSEPPNDDFDSATPFATIPFSEALDTSGATTALDDPVSECLPALSHTVWYSFTPDSDQPVHLDTAGSGYAPALSVWTGSRGALIEVACNDQFGGGNSALSFPAESGTTYFILVASGLDKPGGELQLAGELGEPPPNDDFDDAALVAELPFSETLDTGLATLAPDDPLFSCLGPLPPSDQMGLVWYRFDAPADMGVKISTAGSDYETIAAVWTGARGDLTEVACGLFNHEDDLFLSAAAGTTYWIGVTQFFGVSGELAIAIDEASAATNDDVEAATILSLPGHTPAGNRLASTAQDDPSPSCGAGSPAQQSKSVWFQYTPAQDHTLAVALIAPTFSPVLAIYTGAPGALEEADCSTDPSPLTPLLVDVAIGETYWIEVA